MKKSTTKILLAHSSSDLYGASKVLINIVEILISEGYKVYLFLPEKGPLNENNIIKKCNVKIIEFGVFRKRYFNFFGLINRLYYIFKSTFVFRSFILKNKIDLVYTKYFNFNKSIQLLQNFQKYHQYFIFMKFLSHQNYTLNSFNFF